MRFDTFPAVAVASFAANAVASPLAEAALAPRQVASSSCLGPVVNFFGYIAQGCVNDGSPTQLFNVLKFAPLPQDTGRPYYSSCLRVNTPSDTAASFAYTSDGFNLNNCYLVTFERDDCTGASRNWNLQFGFSRCQTAVVGSANVFCTTSGTKVKARDIDDFSAPLEGQWIPGDADA